MPTVSQRLVQQAEEYQPFLGSKRLSAATAQVDSVMFRAVWEMLRCCAGQSLDVRGGKTNFDPIWGSQVWWPVEDSTCSVLESLSEPGQRLGHKELCKDDAASVLATCLFVFPAIASSLALNPNSGCPVRVWLAGRPPTL